MEEELILDFAISTQNIGFAERCKITNEIFKREQSEKFHIVENFDYETAYTEFVEWMKSFLFDNEKDYDEYEGFKNHPVINFEIFETMITANSCPDWSEEDSDWAADFDSQSTIHENTSISQTLKRLNEADRMLTGSIIFSILLIPSFVSRFVEEDDNKNRLIHSGRDKLYFSTGSHVGSIFTFGILTKEGFSAMKVEHASGY
ncbi:hypothetical protein [Leptospira alstonii]|uniref:Uncharacterized protein n=2 Tax=Leptospira alstonii TaxID=28452 RepID=M6D6J6_9LEPT|nr:hypothetical protein [Leptospira alstonii]EMJ94180.1 hypothetical protein LEP1GSC194_0152 [Leptospira alstonii serovar Sichuan str. 79601]EQA79156.1 hypothetical protein LEP1GSC193_2708 [Leptospira alstonii serovar Pingchang str. 80-412]